MKLLLKNGKIYQSKENFTDALYIEDGVIVLDGREALAMEKWLSSHEIMDLLGKTVVPGFNDAHLHFHQTGLALETVNLYGSSSVSEVIERGKKFLVNLSEDQPLVGRGFNQDYFHEKVLPNRMDLDQISTERPVIFTRACSHLAVVNSLALEMLFGNDPLPSVSGGSIDLGEDGKPNGIFRENSILLLDALYEEETEERILSRLKNAARAALKEGLTSLQVNDLWMDSPSAEAMEKAFERFTREEDSVRIYHQLYFRDPKTFEERILTGWDRSSNAYNRYGLLKMYADGSLGARTAYMRKPYADDPSTLGMPTMSEESLVAFMSLAERNGIQMAIHVIGDAALEMVLNCYEKTILEGNPHRHGLIHVQITDIPLLQRIRKLNLLVYAQPIFIHNDLHIVKDRVGEEMASTSYAFGKMEELGIKVAYSTDSPIESLSVMDNLHCAVNRQDLNGYPLEGYYPAQRVDRSTALDNATLVPAYASFEEDRKGRLQKGYYADLVVLSAPYFDVDASEIRNIKVEKTMINGRIIYDKSNPE